MKIYILNRKHIEQSYRDQALTKKWFRTPGDFNKTEGKSEKRIINERNLQKLKITSRR